ncbi:MAG: GNAT family N-acetyltransferase [Collimonas sp.]|uniref:GNAT family N-acetyltransferase n=1 Tax=Collimonas sp. TaxID=1963772 RepID=UPI00326760EB
MTTPSPDLDLVRSLEERALNAWPAQQSALCGGWLLRLSEGYTKRANSANPLHPTADFAEMLRLVEDFYARHGLPPIFRITPLATAGATEALEQAGYRMVDPTLLMTMPLAAADRPAHDVLIQPTATPEWSNGFTQANRVPLAAQAAHERMLAAITMPAAFATLMDQGRPVAYGLAVAENGMVGLFDIVVAPEARQRGAATRLVNGLLGWGKTQGANSAYLQVTATNLAATALYRKLGFNTFYHYHYWIRS